MRKNILAVIILAATLINLTLTAVLLFVYMPTVNQTNTLITKVAQIIDLELESQAIDIKTIDIGELDSYLVADELTINLSPSGDGKQHMAVVKCSLSLNKNAEDYTKVKGLLEQFEGKVLEVINNEVSKMTYEEFIPNKDIVKDVILKKLQTEVFHSECIVEITFSKWVSQ